MPAPPPTSEVEICNLALARIGQPPITSVDSPTGFREEVVARQYPVTRRGLLRAYVFNFSKKYAQLTVDSGETPAYGYTNAFLLPNDWLRLLSLGDHTINADTPKGLYDIVGRYLYTDYEDATDTVNLNYIRDITQVGLWDSLFVNLMRLELARDLAGPFTLKESKIKALDEELKNVRLQAAAVAGQEKPPRRIERSKFRDRRKLGFSYRDPTRSPF